MIRKTHLAAALVFGAALAGSGMALAQTHAASAAPATAPATSTPATPQSPPSSLPSATPPVSSSDQRFSEPAYGVDPPPDTPSGVYLPGAVLGYAKSAAGCVVVGCTDGPQASGAAGPATPGPPPPAPATPPPANPGSPAPN